MFGLGIWEIALILAVALVVLGPQKLPMVAKQLGRGLRELRRAASDFQVTLEQEADAEEIRQRRNLPVRAPTEAVPAAAAAAAHPVHETDYDHDHDHDHDEMLHEGEEPPTTEHEGEEPPELAAGHDEPPNESAKEPT
ncbi:MAG: Sec-independent protein translocase protein TatB [Myxococcota bacterium]